jgi:CheY-like chemotaxis protein
MLDRPVPPAPAAGDAATPPTQCVLVVDDDQAVREMFAQALRLAGFDVVEASTGAEALELLRSSASARATADKSGCADATADKNASIGVILLDLKMPDMDGWRFRLTQRADPRLAAIPTVITTGVPLSEVLDCDLKAADYLLKPVGVEHLISVVAHYVKPARETSLVW